MKVWVTFALDWTGFDIIGVHKTSVEAESVCAKMKPFVMAEEQELPDSVPFEDAKEHFINVYDEAFKAKMAGSQAH